MNESAGFNTPINVIEALDTLSAAGKTRKDKRDNYFLFESCVK